MRMFANIKRISSSRDNINEHTITGKTIKSLVSNITIPWTMPVKRTVAIENWKKNWKLANYYNICITGKDIFDLFKRTEKLKIG